jgi:hypothetical protein
MVAKFAAEVPAAPDDGTAGGGLVALPFPPAEIAAGDGVRPPATPSPAVLLDPADAHHFRVKVGRYGDRWYTDPLPGDKIAEASDWVGPAFSIVKGASGKDWTFVGLQRVARSDRLEHIAKLDEPQRYDALKSINKHGLNVAAGRGTILHWWAEDTLRGRTRRVVDARMLSEREIPPAALDEANRYLPALLAFFDTYQPELAHAEFPAFHRTLNGVGYGCTPDGLMVIERELWAYDFKSRSGDNAAYPEDCMQIAAGLRAEYMIVDGEDGPARRHIPAVAGGLVISVAAEGCRVYPIDVDKSFEHFTAAHAWWVARRTEKDCVARVWPVRKRTPSAPTAPSCQWCGMAQGHSEVCEGFNVNDPGRARQPSRGDLVARLGQHPDEGAMVDPERFAELERVYRALDQPTRDWFQDIVKESAQAGVDVRAHNLKSERRLLVYSGLLTLAANGHTHPDVVRACVAKALDSDAPLFPTITVGHGVGALDATTAYCFVYACRDFANGELAGVVDADDGLLRLVTV